MSWPFAFTSSLLLAAAPPAAPAPAAAPTLAAKEEAPAKPAEGDLMAELIQKLKELDLQSDISAKFNQDDKVISLRIVRGKSLVTLEWDPEDPNVYFYIHLKDKSAAAAPRTTPPKAGTAPTPAPESGSALEQRIQDLIKAMTPAKAAPTSGLPAIPLKAMDHLFAAQRHYVAKSYRAALAEVTQSLQLAETALALALKGTVLLALEDQAGAAAAWKRSFELDPTNAEVEAALKQLGEAPDATPPPAP